MIHRGLRAKIINITVGLTLIGFGILVFLVIKEEERSLLNERLKASELMAQPILHAIYKDMLEERADMARFLIDGLKTIKGVERVQLIRVNGVEEAFQDHKTLKEVKAEFGEIKPEWLADHQNKLNNVAKGIGNPEFKKALQGFNGGKKEAVYYIEKENDRNLFTYLMPISARPKCSGCHAREEEARGVLMISTSLDEMYGLITVSRNRWIIYGLATAGAITLVLSLLVSAVITRPVRRAVGMLRDIAEGKGDLTRRLDASSADEIGMLGRWFNKFAQGMQYMVGEIFGISQEVSSASKDISKSSREIMGAVQKQIKAVDDTSSSIKEMDVSIKVIAGEARELNESSKDVSEAVRTMSASVEDVSGNLDKLFYSASSTNASINEIAISINQVATHVEDLFKKTEDVVSSIMSIGNKVKEIENYSRSQAEVAEKVRLDAEDIGLSSVVRTKDEIEKLSSEVSSAASTVNRLGETSKEIGKILTVINDIADTTHLLALNATILANQAGEHGKGFAVVARQVKDLATKTTASTKEIAELITQVQNDVSSAMESMQRSSEKVKDGVKLSRDAQDALMKILESARSSFEMSKQIERATIEQTLGVGHIVNAAQMISGMVGEIKSATTEESEAASGILDDTIQMRSLMEKVKLSTIEQARQTRLVTEAIFRVVEKIRTVAEATEDQTELSRRIVEAVDTVREVAEGNTALATRLEKTVKEMDRQSETLKSAVGSFKT